MKFSGGDLVENGCFQRVKFANVGGFSDFLMGRQLGGDASENGDFQRGKQRLHGPKFFSGAFILYSERNTQLGAMRRKMAIFKAGNSVCRVQFFSGALILYF